MIDVTDVVAGRVTVLKAYTVIRRGKTIWEILKHEVGLAKGMEKKVTMIKKWMEQEAVPKPWKSNKLLDISRKYREQSYER